MEEFRDVPGYEGLYQVSNLGNVKSLPKEWRSGECYRNTRRHNGKILKSAINSKGYLTIGFFKDEKRKTFSVHQLVAMAFLNHIPCGYDLVCDHLNDIKTDNRLENLQLVTARFNTCKTQGKYSSKYKGVSFNKLNKKWISYININGKRKHLGYFNCELAASIAYQNKLKTL
jgi:hypothetical protein